LSGTRKLSQALAEGNGISVLVEVADVAAARAAEEQGADALVVRAPLQGLEAATQLPVVALGEVAGRVDAVVLAAADGEETLAERAAALAQSGLECVLRVAVEEEVERILEALDPEIFLVCAEAAADEQPELDRMLELLSDIPAGKLAVAELPDAGPGDVVELERAGFDAVLVRTSDVRRLVGHEPPDV
jgi:indole-3-glycerol phosphate synthase